MTKEITQKRFRISVQEYNKSHDSIWLHRIQNNPLAYQQTEADYLISFLCRGAPILALVECKQVTDDDRISVSRFKQMTGLCKFDTSYRHHQAYFLINFWRGSARHSNAFMIPAIILRDYIDVYKCASIKESEFISKFGMYQLSLIGKYYDVERFINSIRV